MTRVSSTRPAVESGSFEIGGDLPVVRLGYGAMRLTGPGIWGEPRDHDAIAQQIGATTGQLALAWLLRRSQVMLPIPGTSSGAHLEQNVSAADVQLSDDQFAALDKAL
jgi:diketogulonate reductase-like aldo/keto reductase